jgi:transcriptional regulator with PAS, ATPase and Fis domain
VQGVCRAILEWVTSPTATLLTTTDAGAMIERSWRIEVCDGPDAGLFIERSSGTVLIGAQSGSDLVLTDPGVSRQHLELRLHPEGIEAKDLGSKNGSRVGNARVERAFLVSGAEIRVGRSTLRVSSIDRPLEVDGVDRFGDFVTRSEPMRQRLGQIALAAGSEATILLEGETGTGKELIARAIHEASPRASGPYVVLDCASIEANLLASQLFGHVEGAFTGALASRIGAFERADGGTVFLDELGELPLDLQPRLLRVLENRTLVRLGEDHERSIDCRFVAATHRSLVRMVEQRTFRADLYHRIAVVRAKILPLRERPEDLEPLVRSFADRFGHRAEITKAAIDLLAAYDWPGNARELKNAVERAVVFAKGDALRPEHLFPEEPFDERYDQALLGFERRYLRALLAKHDGVISRAADAAGLSRGGLYKVMKRAGL